MTQAGAGIYQVVDVKKLYRHGHLMAARAVFAGVSLSRKRDRGGAAFGNRELPYPVVAFVSPRASDLPGRRIVDGFELPEPPVRSGFHEDVSRASVRKTPPSFPPEQPAAQIMTAARVSCSEILVIFPSSIAVIVLWL